MATTSQDAVADIGSVHDTVDDTIIKMKRSVDVGLIKAPNLFTDVVYQLGRQQTANQHLLDVQKHVATIQARSEGVEANYQGIITAKQKEISTLTARVQAAETSAKSFSTKYLGGMIALGIIVAVGGVLLMGTSPWGFRLVLAGLALTGLSSMVLAMMPALVWLFYGVAVLTVGFLAYSLWVNRKALVGAVGLVEKIKPMVPEGTVSGIAAELHTPLVSKVIDSIRAN